MRFLLLSFRNHKTPYITMKKLAPFLIFSLLITTSIILNSCGESNSLDDVPLSKQTYSQWKEYIDSKFKKWCDSGKEMSNDDLKQMYIVSAWTMENDIEKNLQEFANLSQSQVSDLKQYANQTCKSYIDKINVSWNNNEVKSKPNRYN